MNSNRLLISTFNDLSRTQRYNQLLNLTFNDLSPTQRYKSFNARVEKKDGNTLIESIVESIGRMLNRKMDAVKCIVNKSEEYAEEFHRNFRLANNFTYYSSKYSLV